MGLSLILQLALWAAWAQVEVSQIDRPTYEAELLEINNTSIRVSEGSRESTIPLEKLRKVRFPTSEKLQTTANAKVVTLVDGSTFNCSEITSDGELASFSLAGGNIDLTTDNVLQIQLQVLTPEQLIQWQAISQSRIAGDIIVLIRSAEALEKLEGVIHAIKNQTVTFEFGGQMIDAPMERLAGIRFYSVQEEPKSDNQLAAIVLDQAGNRWLTAALTADKLSPDTASPDTAANLTLMCGAVIKLPVEQLKEIDYSSGSMLFLADLEPIRLNSTTGLKLKIPIPGAETLFGQRRIDIGKPGALSLGALALGPSLEFLGSGSSTYRVPSGFTRLVGAVELRPTGNRFSPCTATVLLENEVLWKQRLAETGKPQTIDVSIAPDARLQLDVQAEGEMPVGDVVIWQEIRFVK